MKISMARIRRWTAELLLVFIGVYAAFWLNTFQLHREQAKRRDQILASLERTLEEGVAGTGIRSSGWSAKSRSLIMPSQRVRCHTCPGLLSRPPIIRAI